MENKKGYVDSYVAFIDILGFKEFIQNNDFKKVNGLFSDIKTIQNKALYCFNQIKKYNGLPVIGSESNMTINIISDSIIISIPKNSVDSLINLLSTVNQFSFTLLHNYNLLCRGAIAEGDFYADQNITYGSALVKAYIMENKLAVYPRIIFTRNTIESYTKNCEKKINDIIKNVFIDLDVEDDLFYSDYIKSKLYHLSYFVNNDHTKKDNVGIIFNSIQKNIECKISNETDSHIREKYLYFKRYYNNAILSVKEILPFPIPFPCDLIL